jgi:hypothetical protein
MRTLGLIAATPGLLLAGLEAAYSVMFLFSGFTNFLSIRPYVTILVLASAILVNMSILKRRKEDEELDLTALTIASLFLTAAMLVPLIFRY